jgi:hypothetical protein
LKSKSQKNQLLIFQHVPIDVVEEVEEEVEEELDEEVEEELDEDDDYEENGTMEDSWGGNHLTDNAFAAPDGDWDYEKSSAPVRPKRPLRNSR